MARSAGEMTPEEFKELIFLSLNEIIDKIDGSIVATLEELLNLDTMRFVEKSREDIKKGKFKKAQIEKIDDILK